MRRLGAPLNTARLAIRRTIMLRRRLLAAVLASAAVLAGIRATAAPAPPSDWVVVAAHDLEAGVVLGADDLTRAAFADGTAPAGAAPVEVALGRTLAAPLRQGEPVTDVRLVGAGLLKGYEGLVAVPIRIPDPGVVGLVKVGDRVNLLATDPRGGGTDVVAADVPVLALPAAAEADSGLATTAGLSGALIVIGITEGTAPIVADAAVQRYLSLSLTH